MADFSNKRCLIWDEGQFGDLATTLAPHWGQVDYYKPWKKSAPTSVSGLVGHGMEGVNRVMDFFDHVDGADLIVFTDCYQGDLQVYLEKQGHRVWGSRRADRFEWDRELFAEMLKEVGLPVAPYKIVVGITRLREYLIEHDDQIVKFSVFRGDGETFDVPRYQLRKSKLDAMEYQYGPFAEKIRFMVQSKILTKIECGYDGYAVDDNFLDGFVDYETKNRSCLIAARKYADLPETVRLVNEAIAPVMKRERYRAPFGTEIRVDEEGVPFFIDWTGRNSSPPGEALWVMTKNLSEIMYHGAAGEAVPVEWAAKYACQLMLNLHWQDLAWSEVAIPNKVKPWIQLATYAKTDGLYYPIANEGYEPLPWGVEIIGSAIGIADTIEEAIEKAKEHADAVEGFKVEYDIAAVAEGIEAIKAGEKEGIEFAEEVPEPAIVLESSE